MQSGVHGAKYYDIKLDSVDLLWPYVADARFVWDVYAVFSLCLFCPWVAPNPPAEKGSTWTFVNVHMQHGHALAVVLAQDDAGLSSYAASASSLASLGGPQKHPGASAT